MTNRIQLPQPLQDRLNESVENCGYLDILADILTVLRDNRCRDIQAQLLEEHSVKDSDTLKELVSMLYIVKLALKDRAAALKSNLTSLQKYFDCARNVKEINE